MIRLIYILLIGVSSLTAQNLIPNGGFEFESKKSSERQLSYCQDWYEFRSADWINLKTDNPSIQWDKKTKPFNGQCFVGISLQYGQDKHSEYLAINIKEHLIKDEVYYFSCHLHLRDKYWMTKTFDIFFSDSIDIWSVDFMDSVSQINNGKEFLGKNKTGWFKFESKYVAKGGEEAIYIGNFSGKSKLKKSETSEQRYKGTSYYYIDDMLLEALNSDIHFKYKNEFDDSDVFVFKELTFEIDSFRILPTSYNELNRLTKYLNDNNRTVIIQGHTDSTGLEAKNIILSQNRAKSVYKYLINKGINKNRLSHEGLGSSSPISHTIQKLNRRVEVIFQ